MNFEGCTFLFDGKSSKQFDLILSKIDGAGDFGEATVAGVSSIIEEALQNRWRPIFYGTEYEEKLSFEVTFGVSVDRLDARKPLTRNEVSEITKWLTGHDTYRDLVILQQGFIDKLNPPSNTIEWDPEVDDEYIIDLKALKYAHAARIAPAPSVFVDEGFSYTLKARNGDVIKTEVSREEASGYFVSLSDDVYMVGEGIACVALQDGASFTTDSGDIFTFPMQGIYLGCIMENGELKDFYSEISSPLISYQETRPKRNNCFIFKTIVTELTLIGEEDEVYGMKAEFTCDSPFAYRQPRAYECVVDGNSSSLVVIDNDGGMNRYYSPIVTYVTKGAGDLEIINVSDKNRNFKFTGLNDIGTEITVDNENYVITCANGKNLYPHFNYKFLRLLPGENELVVSGNGVVTIKCQFPVNIGGYISE